MKNDLIGFNWTVDNVRQGDKILFRYNDEVLTEATLISNSKAIPETTGTIRYDTLLLDTFVGLNVKDWDGHSPMTTYLNTDGTINNSVKTAAVGAAA
jgi:hypothetical protein